MTKYIIFWWVAILIFTAASSMQRFRWLVFWILAFLITVGSAAFQRLTGPTYPVSGNVIFKDAQIKLKLERSHQGFTDQRVNIISPEKEVGGYLFWKRYKTNDEFTRESLQRAGDTLFAMMPAQPPAGKLEYFIHLTKGEDIYPFPENSRVVTRFTGEVPLYILVLHVIAMFTGMLLSTRAGLEYWGDAEKIKKLMNLTILFIAVGGFILGPIMQKYAFGEYWTGVPFGIDLTDNKTLIAMIFWVIAYIKNRKNKQNHIYILIASIVTLIVFLIPHSLLGSELDYNNLNQK